MAMIGPYGDDNPKPLSDVTGVQPLRFNVDSADQAAVHYSYSPETPVLVPPEPWQLLISNVTAHKEEEPMRGLFDVYLVNPETGEVASYGPVVAANEAQAQAKALRQQPEAVVDALDDYDVIIRKLGDVRPKRRPQEVKLAK